LYLDAHGVTTLLNRSTLPFDRLRSLFVLEKPCFLWLFKILGKWIHLCALAVAGACQSTAMREVLPSRRCVLFSTVASMSWVDGRRAHNSLTLPPATSSCASSKNATPPRRLSYPPPLAPPPPP
jgi:hypothetical protein